MKAVILAGGLGTRLSEETNLKPKPMVEIGGKPILWHIMKIYSTHGINDFVICLGYKGYVIKEYFTNYFHHMSDLTVDFKNNNIEIHNNKSEPWRVTLVDTGETSMTGGRIARIKPYIENDSAFCLTYGDGVSDVNITELVNFHKQHKKLATLTAVQPAGRFGILEIDQNIVTDFKEKPKGDGSYINGGFFVLSPKALDYIQDGDKTVWEQSPLNNIAADRELMNYKHHGFWQPMDTLRDKNYLEGLWNDGKAPWKIW
ncbi:glucose-1-phosphate cytidylyltransferase [Rickettsiales bacterium]|nr:glucose-1-phosphate cytidylyltransferase [Rickettsiales bacterium]